MSQNQLGLTDISPLQRPAAMGHESHCPGIIENAGVWEQVSASYIENLGLPMDQVVNKFTAKVPLQRLAHVEEVVGLTLFLVSPAADHMTGQAVNLTGGREMH